MSTAYTATSQAWAASRPPPQNLAVSYPARGASLPNPTVPAPKAVSSWRPPVTLFVKLEFGISFGGRDNNAFTPSRRKIALNYPPNRDSAQRTPRFLQPDAHNERRALSEQPRSNRQADRLAMPFALTAGYPAQASQPGYQQQRQQIYSHPQHRAASTAHLPSAPTCYTATSTFRQQSHPNLIHTYAGAPVRPQPRRQLTREFLAGKSLPDVPANYRLGEAGMPWESQSPMHPFVRSETGSLTPHSADAVSPPTTSWNVAGTTADRGTTSNPTSPVISPQSSIASLATLTRANAQGHSRVLSWDAVTKTWTPASNVVSGIGTVVSPLRASTTYDPGPLIASRMGSIATVSSIDRAPSLPAFDFETDADKRDREKKEQEERRARDLERDPQRAEELGVLNAAMVAVDVVGDRFAPEEGKTSMSGRKERRSLGWAVRVEPEDSERSSEVWRKQVPSAVAGHAAVGDGMTTTRRHGDSLMPGDGGPETEYWRAIQRRRSWTTGDTRLDGGMGGIVVYQ